MNSHNTDYLVVTDLNQKPVGLLDARSLVTLLAEDGARNTEVISLVKAPPVSMDINTSIRTAFTFLEKTGTNSLLITAPGGEIAGIISVKEILSSLFANPEMISAEINEARSGKELSGIFSRCHKLASAMVLGNAPPFTVTSFLSSLADRISGRAVELAIIELGEAPCSFSFINAGSVARMESTLVTDQDNGIIFEDVQGQDSNKAEEYFRKLGAKVNKILDEAGYQLCKGANMAGNPKWCQPVPVWKGYFSEWIRNPGPEELLEVSIFFDFRFCYGDPGPAQEVREHILHNTPASDIYFHHMAGAWNTFGSPPLKKSQELTDLKKLTMPLTGLVRLYALRHGLRQHSGPERITGLLELEVFNKVLVKDLLTAWNDLTSLRLRQQVLKLAEDGNSIATASRELAEAGQNLIIKKSLRAINDLKLKAASDFYTNLA
jgi:CBS domain-containing protein